MLRNSGSRYGLVLGLVMICLTMIAPQPIGSVIFWLALSIQLSFGTVQLWRRTGLPFATSAMIIGALVSFFLSWAYSRGYELFSLPLAWGIIVWLSIIAGPLLLFVESRVNPEKWKVWREASENSSVWDMLLGRHIPQLR